MSDMDELRERLTSIILGRTAPAASQAIINELGITPTANSQLNQMVQYETKWLPRNKKCARRRR